MFHSTAFQECSIIICISILLLAGQAGEVWKQSNNVNAISDLFNVIEDIWEVSGLV
jgi:hypothetical protein